MKNEIMERPIEYVTDTGTEVRLTPRMVRDFLISGKSELATEQEIVYFIKLCQARKLNPFLRECYLIKYDHTPAAIITARSTFQNNARMSDDCQGWKFGVIVQDEKGFTKRTAGLVLENQKVVGGWFSAKPRGWDEPFELEVNLSHYIKTTRDGRPTQFWTAEKQAGMIAKVAEVQGLRALWGKNTSGLYDADEITDDSPPVPVFDPEAVNDDKMEISAGQGWFAPEDFDKEFADEIQETEWASFWQRAVDFHANHEDEKVRMDEDQLKVDIMSGDVAAIRVAFNKYTVGPKKTPKTEQKSTKKTTPKKQKSKTAAAVKKSKLEPRARMIQSGAWAGCQAYKDEFPEIYEREVQISGEPESEQDCIDLLDRCQAASNAVDAGDGIPG